MARKEGASEVGGLRGKKRVRGSGRQGEIEINREEKKELRTLGRGRDCR
jgi:hypothetical protein